MVTIIELMSVDIFISAVSDEFGSYREFLSRQLTLRNAAVKIQEDFIAGGSETVDELDQYIRQCAAVIHLAGGLTGSWAKPESLHILRSRYGDLSNRLPPLTASLESGEPPLSYTQWEAYLAVYHGKPLVIAVPESGTKRDTKYHEDLAQQASQRAHLDRLHELGHHVEIKFRNEDQLGLQVMRSCVFDLLVKAASGTPLIVAGTRFLDAAVALLERKDQLRSADRIATARTLEDISRCLATVADQVDRDKFPDKECGEIQGFEAALPITAQEVLGEQQVNKLAETLKSAYGLKQELREIPQGATSLVKEAFVRKTKEASGKFHALASAMTGG